MPKTAVSVKRKEKIAKPSIDALNFLSFFAVFEENQPVEIKMSYILLNEISVNLILHMSQL